MNFNQLYTFTLESRITGQGFSSLLSLLSRTQGEWLNDLRVLPPLPFDFDYSWVNSDGKITKRISKFYFQNHGIKLPESLLSAIGNTIKTHTLQNETYYFDFTKDFDWVDGDFGDEGSCYWGSNDQARDMLYDNDASAIRFFDKDNYGIGRAWIYNTGKFWVLWNGYGFQGTPTLIIAQIFSEFMGLSYKSIGVSNNGSTSGTLYIDGGTGYAIGTADEIHRVYGYDLQFSSPCYCCDCGDSINEDDTYYYEHESYCETCFYEYYDRCSWCGSEGEKESFTEVESEILCDYCLERRFTYCEKCEQHHRGEKCPTCREEKVKK